jgi:phthiocerol/phenolphthiocerol synthesis type-I polyketide synthase E
MSIPHDPSEPSGIEIAIVGMAGRFPGADDVDAFWRNIRDGVASVSHFSDEQLRAQGVPQELLDDPDYVKAGVMFEGFDKFDAGFFGYSPREAETLDPQQRIFLECAWASLEHAGCDAERWPGKVGVYAGEGTNVYLIRNLLPSFGLGAASGIADLLGLMSGNSGGSLCTRVAYKLDLRGPAVTLQTACSTSLTAVHTACQALLSHDCDMALAGGVWLNLLQEGGYRYQAGAILSPDGHCRAFDAKAAGTIIGSGAGIVVLTRLDDALRDGDTIHAVIKGTAANNDGSAKVGFTAPSVDGQAEVIRAAQLIAGVPADTIGYVEAHGTATTLGDPIELAALTQAFRAETERRGFCAVGSVKTNIGHLDAAAGVAGLIKTVMALKHRTLPPSLHYENPNPQIDFAASPFYVNAQLRPWPEGRAPRRAGVSSFGIGGTNVHVVLEEAPAVAAVNSTPGWQVLPVSAKDEAALAQGRAQLAAHLQADTAQSLADVAHTLQSGRRAFAWRSAVVANQSAMAAEMLASPMTPSSRAPAVAPEVVFLFPGGGTQHARMGEALYRDSAVFREELDRCAALLRDHAGIDLLALMFPADGDEAAANERLFRIELAQPALFAVEYAMARWWMSCGVQPTLMLGHSLGEYVAACLSGVFSLEDALRIVATRGRLMQTLAPGAMTAVSLPESELADFLGDGCDLAAVNGEQLCVLAGPVAAIERAEEALRARQHLPRRLHVAIASHSSLVDPIVAELERLIASLPRHAPRIPFLSNATGKPITEQQATSPAYWGRHLRGTVRFADGLREVFDTPGRVVLEVGPGETLAGLARQHTQSRAAAGIWASQAHPQQTARNAQQLAVAIAGLWSVGVDIDWSACRADGGNPRRVPLPTYAFQRKRFWIEAGEAKQPAQNAAAGLFYAPNWQRGAPLPPAEKRDERTGCTLILGDANSFTDRLARTLRDRGEQVVLALRGPRFARTAPRQYALRPGERADHEALLREVEAEAGPVLRLHHLWSLDGDRPAASHAQVFEAGYFSLLALTHALDAVGGASRSPLALTVVTDRVEDVAGTEPLAPEKATLLGLAKILGQEYPSIACRVVDVVLPAPESAAEADLARRVADEAAAAQDEFLVAYRGPHRWLKRYQALTDLAAQPVAQQRLREGGVYLITGGMGGVGLALARYLSRAWKGKLVLLGRTPLPARGDWDGLIADNAQPVVLRRKLQQLIELETNGAQVLPVAADVNDPAQLRTALAAVHARFGGVNGVIHAVVHPDRGMIAQRTPALVEAAFEPKIAGTLALLDALRAEPLDFVLFCSSISVLIGGLGRSDYAAANAYLDALATASRRTSPLPLFSVNWDAWRDVGVAVDMDLPEGVGLDERTGVLAFERIANGPDLPQTVVSIWPLAPRLRPLDDLFDALDDAPAAEVRASHSRPVLQNPYAAPEGELEEVLAGFWSEALGITPVGVHDNLFELGGDSLLAIRLLARVRKAYGVELHPAAFFKAPTIAELATLVELRLIEDIEREAQTTEHAAP